MKYIFQQKGFSLIEVIVALLVFSVITIYFANIFSSSINNNRITVTMSQEIKEATSSIDKVLSGGVIPDEMIVDDLATMTIVTNQGTISIKGYILEGSGNAGNVAFFPKGD